MAFADWYFSSLTPSFTIRSKVMMVEKKERREIRVGKAMVRRSKAMKPLTINPETREGKVLRVLPSGR